MADWFINNGILLRSSPPVPEAKEVDDFAQAGQQNSRTLKGAQYFRFSLLYSMTLTQFDAACAIYDANPRAFYTNFQYYGTSPAQTYTVKPTARPEIAENLGKIGGVHRVSVRVEIRGTLD